jgi:hypothetical protein
MRRLASSFRDASAPEGEQLTKSAAGTSNTRNWCRERGPSHANTRNFPSFAFNGASHALAVNQDYEVHLIDMIGGIGPLDPDPRSSVI